MKKVLRRVAFIAAGYVLVVLAINAVAGITQPELGAGAGEGVLRTFADDGTAYERRLAVLDDNGTLWIVSVQHFRRWYHRLLENPSVELVRNNDVRSYRAVPVDRPETVVRLTHRMERRVGTAQFWLMRAVWLFAEFKVVRLDPV